MEQETQSPGILNQRTFIHNVYDNIIGVIDTCLKGEIVGMGFDPASNRDELFRRLRKIEPAGAMDPFIGTWTWDGREIMSVHRKDGNSGYTWNFVIKTFNHEQNKK